MGKISFQGPDLNELLPSVVEAGFVLPGKPKSILVGDDLRPIPVQDNWFKDCRGKTLEIIFQNHDTLYIDLEYSTLILSLRHTPTPSRLLSMLDRIPFETAAFGPLYKEWKYGSDLKNLWGMPNTGFKLGHSAHGLGCAFKGKGHERISSLRLLEHGPWVLIRKEDMSYVQFHDHEADAAIARKQALPGIQAMGYKRIYGGGILIGKHHVYSHSLEGRYSKEDGIYRILRTGQDVSSIEVHDACELKHRNRNHLSHPIRQLAYVFAFPDEAEKHRHKLWLHGLGCWVIRDSGTERKMDETYNPVIKKPNWVTRVQAMLND